MIPSFTDSWEKCLLIGGYLIIDKIAFVFFLRFFISFFDNKMNLTLRNSKSISKEYVGSKILAKKFGILA